MSDICPNCFGNQAVKDTCSYCGWQELKTDTPSVYLPPGTLLNGKYLTGRVLGHGGFGITYLAWDTNLQIKLAIKEYLPRDLGTRTQRKATVSIYSGQAKEYFEYGMKKFLAEARTLAQFDESPGIVSVRDFFQENGTAYFVMNYVDGITFKEYLAQNGDRISFDLTVRILMPVMDALREVHKAGILHRDISPDNIYITGKKQVKLLDFGAARYVAGEYSRSMSVVMKPGYAPEEQYRTKGRQGPWTDIYALAATIYRAVTGKTPPEALDRLEWDTLPPPSKLGAVIPVAMEKALLCALAVKASDRFQDMEAFQKVLLGQTESVRILHKKTPEVLISSEETAGSPVGQSNLKPGLHPKPVRLIWEILRLFGKGLRLLAVKASDRYKDMKAFQKMLLGQTESFFRKHKKTPKVLIASGETIGSPVGLKNLKPGLRPKPVSSLWDNLRLFWKGLRLLVLIVILMSLIRLCFQPIYIVPPYHHDSFNNPEFTPDWEPTRAEKNRSFCSQCERDAEIIRSSIVDWFAMPTHLGLPTKDELRVSIQNDFKIYQDYIPGVITIEVRDVGGGCPSEYQKANWDDGGREGGWKNGVFTIRIQL